MNTLKLGKLNIGSASGVSKPNGNPSSLGLTVVSGTQLDGSFTIGSTNHDGHKVYISTLPNSGFTLNQTLTGNTNTFSLTSLSEGTLYYCKVIAYKGTTLSQYSNTANATTYAFPYSEPDLLSYWDGTLLQDGSGLKDIKLLSDAKYVESPCLLLINPNTSTFTLGGTYTINNVKYDSDLGTDITNVTIATRTITLTGITSNHKVWNLRIYDALNVLQAHFPICTNLPIIYDSLNGNQATINGTETTDWSWSTQDVYHWFENNGGSKYYRFKNGNYIKPISTPTAIHANGKYSVNVVFNVDSVPVSQCAFYERLVKVGSTQNIKFYFGLNSSANKRLIIGHNGVTNSAATSANVVNLNTTYFVTYVIDNNGSSNSYKIFMNGVEQTITTSNTTLALEAEIQDFAIGAITDGTRYISGFIEEVSDFNCAFSLAEHQEWYNSGNPIAATAHSQAANLVLAYKSSGMGIAKDDSTNANHLQASNTTNAFCFIPKKASTSVNSIGITCNRATTNSFKGSCKLQPNPNNVASLTAAGITTSTKWTDLDLINFLGLKSYAYRVVGGGITNIITFANNLSNARHKQCLEFIGYSIIDTYIKKGQSNAYGVAAMADLPVTYQGAMSNVLVYYGSGWKTLNSTLNNNQWPSPANQFGLEMSMMKTLATKPIRLINYAVGGSYLYAVAQSDWNAANTGELLDLSQALVTQGALDAQLNNIILNIKKYVWYQGEADSALELHANAYKANEDALWTDEKAYFATIKNIIISDMVMVDVQPKDIGTYQGIIRTAKATRDIENTDVVAFDATSYEHSGVHLTAAGYVDIGIAIANL